MTSLGKKIQPSESIMNLGKKQPEQLPAQDVKVPSENDKAAAPEPVKTLESFVPREPHYRFDQVILPDKVRQEFVVLRSRIDNHKLLYEEWGLNEIDPQGKHTAFNVYGPPGTGKTMCVEALANELGKLIIDVSYAEIESKYVGETGKNIVAAFKAAKTSGALLFFDEADSILGKRMTNVTQAADHGVNVARAVMLKQLDEFDGIVAFATNLARNFDGAFVRRILQHIEIPVPDYDGRLKLWHKMLSDRVPGRQSLNWEKLAKKSAGFSGGDIKNAVVNALAAVAARPPETRHVAQDDILNAIEGVNKAKHDVGSSNPRIIEELVSRP